MRKLYPIKVKYSPKNIDIYLMGTVMASASRLRPLPLHYQRMKEQYLSSYRERGFKGYRSPWVPVADSNRGLLKRGDLVISGYDGKERPFEGRELEVIQNGEVIGVGPDLLKKPPILVWADSRNREERKHLDGNPFADDHVAYSEAMERMLRTASSSGFEMTEEVKFPLYHETSYVYANNILINGINYSSLLEGSRTNYFVGGKPFFAGRSVKGVLRKGSLHGAIIELSAALSPLPLWLNIGGARYWAVASDLIATIETIQYATSKAEGFNYSHQHGYGLYTVCAELSASALAADEIVHIFDQFEKYKASRVLVAD